MTRTRSIHYCNVCDYKTDRKYDRDKHVTRMHGNKCSENVKINYCVHCNYKSTRMWCVKRHIGIKHSHILNLI